MYHRLRFFVLILEEKNPVIMWIACFKTVTTYTIPKARFSFVSQSLNIGNIIGRDFWWWISFWEIILRNCDNSSVHICVITYVYSPFATTHTHNIINSPLCFIEVTFDKFSHLGIGRSFVQCLLVQIAVTTDFWKLGNSQTNSLLKADVVSVYSLVHGKILTSWVVWAVIW